MAIWPDPAHLAGADTEAQRMWRWHAIEEIEHKAVAFDTLLVAMRSRSGFRRWTLRSFTMLAAGVRFHYVLYRNTADLLRQDGTNNLRTWGRQLAYLYDQPGLIRLLRRAPFTYFHPHLPPAPP